MDDLQMGQLIESVKQLIKNQDKHDIIHEKINGALEKLNDKLIADMATAKAQQRNLKIYMSILIVIVNIIISIVQGVL